MAFVNPIWLWGLSALSVPLAIHLLSRKEGKVIPVGSLRHLKDANTQQFKSLRLNELLLLLIRCLLIILVVLFISGLQLRQDSQQKWVLVEDALNQQPQAQRLVDSLTKLGYEAHRLSPDFPTLDEGSPIAVSALNYWQLSEQLKSKPLSDAIVITSARVESFSGERSEKPTSLRWINLPVEPHDYVISAVRKNTDSVLVKQGSMKDENTHHSVFTTRLLKVQKFYKTGVDSIAVSLPDTLTVLLASDPAFDHDRQIMLALLRAIQKTVPHVLIINESKTDGPWDNTADWLIWLSAKQAPPAAQRLMYLHESLSPALYQRSPGDWIITKRLNEQTLLDEHLSLSILHLLFPSAKEWETASEKDQRIMPEKMMWSATADLPLDDRRNASFVSLDAYVVGLIVLLLITERLTAYKRNQ